MHPDPREEIMDGLKRVQEGIDRVFADLSSRIAKLEEWRREQEERHDREDKEKR